MYVDVKFKTKFLDGIGPFFFARSRSLLAELIARKGDEIKSLRSVFLTQCPQSWIIEVLKGSFAGDVQYHENLISVLRQRLHRTLHLGLKVIYPFFSTKHRCKTNTSVEGNLRTRDERGAAKMKDDARIGIAIAVRRDISSCVSLTSLCLSCALETHTCLLLGLQAA